MQCQNTAHTHNFCQLVKCKILRRIACDITSGGGGGRWIPTTNVDLESVRWNSATCCWHAELPASVRNVLDRQRKRDEKRERDRAGQREGWEGERKWCSGMLCNVFENTLFFWGLSVLTFHCLECTPCLSHPASQMECVLIGLAAVTGRWHISLCQISASRSLDSLCLSLYLKYRTSFPYQSFMRSASLQMCT